MGDKDDKDKRVVVRDLPEPSQKDSESFSITKLDNHNYTEWKREAMNIFGMKGLSKYLKESGESTDRAELSARHIILSSITTKWKRDVNGCITAKEMWDRLAVINGQETEACLASLTQQFYGIKHQDEAMSAHISRVEHMRQQLESMGEPVSDRAFCGVLMNSLKERYQLLKQSWQLIPPNDRTPARLVDMVLNLNRELTEDEIIASALVAKKKTSIEERKKSSTCAKCGHKGHWARECRTKPENYIGPKIPQKNWAM